MSPQNQEKYKHLLNKLLNQAKNNHLLSRLLDYVKNNQLLNKLLDQVKNNQLLARFQDLIKNRQLPDWFLNEVKEKHLVSWLPIVLLALGLVFLASLLFNEARLKVKDPLTWIKQIGVIKVLTYNGPTTYYEGPDGPLGFEYDLVKGFADSLGVKLEMINADNFPEILPRLKRGEADFAAAGITITPERKKTLLFTPGYQEIKQQVVYGRGNSRPRSIKDLAGREIEVVANSSFVESLNEIKAKHPDTSWKETTEKTVEELLIEVWQGLLELTVSDSNILSVVRQHYPQLQVALNLKTGDQLAWVFRLSDDNSLHEAASKYLKEQSKNGTLSQLLDRYYGPSDQFNYINMSVFQGLINTRLPLYEHLFKQAAKLHNLDWRLLAAVGYQESKWNPLAVSPTKVRGIMQLTLATSKRFNVTDRTNPKESIFAGAKYISELIDQMPPDVEEPDRTWFALASYNVGFGHLLDVRKITRSKKGDANKWLDIKKYLPLLSKPSWYRNTKYGYARGNEPVTYVTRIRTFYDVLSRLDDEREAKLKHPGVDLSVPAL